MATLTKWRRDRPSIAKHWRLLVPNAHSRNVTNRIKRIQTVSCLEPSTACLPWARSLSRGAWPTSATMPGTPSSKTQPYKQLKVPSLCHLTRRLMTWPKWSSKAIQSRKPRTNRRTNMNNIENGEQHIWSCFKLLLDQLQRSAQLLLQFVTVASHFLKHASLLLCVEVTLKPHMLLQSSATYYYHDPVTTHLSDG